MLRLLGFLNAFTMDANNMAMKKNMRLSQRYESSNQMVGGAHGGGHYYLLMFIFIAGRDRIMITKNTFMIHHDKIFCNNFYGYVSSWKK